MLHRMMTGQKTSSKHTARQARRRLVHRHPEEPEARSPDRVASQGEIRPSKNQKAKF
jgi:hypothetical protein